MAESGLTITPVVQEEEDKGILESFTEAVGLTSPPSNSEDNSQGSNNSQPSEEEEEEERPGILETLTTAVGITTGEEVEEEETPTPAFLQTQQQQQQTQQQQPQQQQTQQQQTKAQNPPKKERKKREKRMPIPTNAETFFRAMNKYPALFKFTPTGDLQVPTIRDKAAFVIPLPNYSPLTPDQRLAKEQERSMEINRVQREYDEKAEDLRSLIETWRITGIADAVVTAQRDMKKLDAELSLLRSPSRWTKGKMGVQQREVFWDKPTIASPLGHRVFLTRIRDIANKDLFVETTNENSLTPPPPFTPPGVKRGEEPETTEPEVFVLFDAPEAEDEEHGFLSPETMVEFIFNETKYTSALQAFHGERLTQLKRKDLRPLLFRLRGGMAIRKFATRVVGKVEDSFALWKQILQTLLQQHPRFATKLRATGDDVLVYANELDGEFGIGLGQDSEEALDKDKWKGDNILGSVWMKIREELPPLEEEGEEEKAQEGGAYKEHGKTEEEAKEQRQRVLMGLYHRRKFQH
jgi:predicted NAD-dependent protein-ADP-ribosyltransferase YbiA (DUF1768 family)